MIRSPAASARASEGSSHIFKMQNVKKSFGENNVLVDVSLALEGGSKLAVLGPGGCGKSTLLKALIGVQEPDEGTVEVLGKNIYETNFDERREVLSKVGVAFQQGALFDFMTVRENVVFAMENMTELSYFEMEERATMMLEAVNLPKAGHKLPSELSGGMRRRVGIVRALCTHPELAVLDEPTAGLDPVTSTIVIELIHRLAAETHSSLVCMTSNVEVAFRFAKKVAILRDGRIVGPGTWEELHGLGDDWISRFLDVRGFKPPVESQS